MKIIIGSENSLKLEAVKLSFQKLGIEHVTIDMKNVESGVPSKPINDEILRGAKNRVHDLYLSCKEEGTSYDYYIGIESGYTRYDRHYFLCSYAVIMSGSGLETIGGSGRLPITEELFTYIQNGGSMNQLIKLAKNIENENKKQELSAFLTEEMITRKTETMDAVVHALIPQFQKEKYELLHTLIANKLEI